MRRATVIVVLLFLAACGGSERGDALARITRNPVSVRGWVHDVRGAQQADSADLEIARRGALFQSISLWVEDSPYSSGGIAENGAFVVLDVPPQAATLGFNAPGAENAKITLEGVPPNADVLLPDVVLEPGGATFLDPSKLVVRLPANVRERKPTGRFATVNGVRVPIVDTPLAEMTERREYPDPGGFRPVAIVK